MNFNAVKKSVSNLKLNKQFIPLAVSALARARADWIYGLNMTRLCTLQGQKSGYQGVLSIGRVQTPILGLIVNRDLNIESFVSKPFYEVEAFLQTEKREVFVGKWKPSEACQPYMDAENRVLSKPLAQNVVDRITQKTGKIINIDKNNQQQPPPLPFSLSSLQISAAKAFGMSAKQVLDTCQQLYERHKLITYPRSDCQYLPKEHLKEAASVTSAIAAIAPDLASTLNTIDLKKKSRAWDDKKVSAHHAIIPTSRSQKSGSLSATEIKVYGLIAKQYLAQFFPNHRYAETSVTSEIEGGTFLTKQKQILDLGWKSLLFSEKSNRSTNASADAKNNSNNAKNQSLPADLKVGDSLFCHSGEVLEKNTSPPKHFTDATLLSALTGIGRYVTDPAIKKSLRETDGLGTEATRAGIIELLFKRQYIIRSGKDIKATEVGRKLITALPSQISQPNMTALWESQLESISQQTLNYKSFIGGVESNLHCLIEDVKKVSLAGLPAFTGKRRFNKKRSTTKKNTKAA
jgi:DNA topoisomerase-3